MDIREYNVTYIAKEFLIRNGWAIIAFNPPGSQGTFTIPNPAKDGAYRGQTGSLSPDIIALKIVNEVNVFLIVESKPIYSDSDITKMTSMFSRPDRRELFLRIVKGHCEANNIQYNPDRKTVIQFAKAHGGAIHTSRQVSTISVIQKEEWNAKTIDPTQDIYSKFSIKTSGLLLKD